MNREGCADREPFMYQQRSALVTVRTAIHGPPGALAGLLAAALLVSACAGGNKYAGEPPCIDTHEEGCLPIEEFEERATALAEDYRTRGNFPAQWGFAAINAHEAYARLALAEGEDVEPGAGQTIGIIDTGIDERHPLFYGKTVTEVFLEGASDEIGDEFSHGTAVASIIAGIRIPPVYYYPHGVAWGADLAVFAIPLGTAPPIYNPISLEGLARNDASDAAQYQEVLAWENNDRRLDFLNLSFGYSGLIDMFTGDELHANYGETIGVLAQPDADEKTILVWAASNAHGTQCIQDEPWCVDGEVDAASPGITAGLPVYIEEMRGHTLAVVAVGEDGNIADFSNRCGSVAEWCLAAPGGDVVVAYFGPGREGPGFHTIASGGGTSFAAPMVTGGLAVMKHVFRDQLPNTALASRLLATADRTGDYADAAIYGRGLMDLGAATSPVGATGIAQAGTVEGESVPLAATGVTAGGALGDGLARSFAGQEIAAFDSLGAPFWFDLGDFVSVRDVPSTAVAASQLHGPDLRAARPWRAANSLSSSEARQVGPRGRRAGRIAARAAGYAGRCRGWASRARRARPDPQPGRPGRPLRHRLLNGRNARRVSCHRRLAVVARAGHAIRPSGRLAGGARGIARNHGKGRVRRPVGRHRLRRHRRESGSRRLESLRGRGARHGHRRPERWADRRHLAPDDERIRSPGDSASRQ